MQDNMPSQTRELICINVDKVYDWIVKELSFDFTPSSPIHFPGLDTESLEHATVECKVFPDPHHPITILSRENRTFVIDGKSVCLQQLTIKKKFKYNLFITLRNGQVFKSEDLEVSRNEQVVLCAPKGTDVEVTYTDLDCFVSSTGMITHGNAPHRDKISFSDLSVTVSVCQSIQSTFPVTVEFLAEFCEPRANLALTCQPSCRPKQCSFIFPHGD